MTTLLDRISIIQKEQLPDDLDFDISSKLKTLLKITFNENLSDPYDLNCIELLEVFIYDNNKKIDISYFFKFGIALIYFHRDLGMLKVLFLCNQNNNNLYNCDVNYEVVVDDDLNFQSFSFWRLFEFSKDFRDNKKYTAAWSNLLFHIEMDNFFNFSKNFLYRNEESYNISPDDKKNLFDYGLNPVFYLSSRHFDELLLKFLKYCIVNTQHFYVMFPHYPNHICCMQSLSKTVDLLNIFCEEYRDNLTILEYNLLLLDMQGI
jgi:hypothetical protein